MSDNPTNTSSGLSYASAGVDIDAGNALVEAIKPAVKSTARSGSNPDIGGFGGLFDLAATGFKDPVLVAANDGVGTKLRVAIESGEHSTVGIDLVAMCVNDLIVQGAEPLFFLDYFATGSLDVETATSVINGIAAGCKEAGAALIGGETAEMPGMYSDGDYDLAGFAVGAVERDQILPMKTLCEGDIILGLGSSGVHSNGYSLVRKIVEKRGLTWSESAPFDSEKSLGQALLEPTRIYVRSMLAAIRETASVKALAHITGGGFTENIPRVLPTGLNAKIELSALKPASVFGWLMEEGNIAEAEMLRTFNCGSGMVVVVSKEQADALATRLTDLGETVSILGSLSNEGSDRVQFSGSVSW